MQIYVTENIPERFLCLCCGSHTSRSPTEKPVIHILQCESFVFAPQLNIPCLPSELQTLLLQPHLSPVMESVRSGDGEEERDIKMNPQELLIWQE